MYRSFGSEVTVIEALDRQATVSNRDLRAALGVPRATAQRDLDDLVARIPAVVRDLVNHR